MCIRDRINIDSNQELAQQLRIQSVPTVMAFFDAKPINGFAGLKPKNEIISLVQELINATSHSESDLKEITDMIEKAEKELHSGNYKVKWNGENSGSGVYFVQMISGENNYFVQTNRMILIK